ncbi:MAG TPA: DPP IV N-terminal domain-containing protein [Puia sp.]|nr:DPP IV N-terminal domain-containing protein [Puia sp.]
MKQLISSIACFLFIFTFCNAQKKEIAYEQIFRDAPTTISKPLPDVLRWIDDEHYLERRAENRKTSFLSVDAKTGNAVSYEPVSTKIGVTGDIPEDGKNPSRSPDGKWVAYTRANNLFAKEISTGKQIQFTHDGSEDISNGYAAWVYYEEMLGRNYQAFWWSPDSRHIAFIHFDESEVPLYPIYNSEGKHGSLEKCHYPQAGDKNPAVKLGIVSVTNPAILWADFNEKDDQYFGPPFWLPDGSSLWAQWIARNQQELKIFAIDTSSGSKKQVYEEKQKTWVSAKYGIRFLEKSNQYIINSDKSGWDHLYLYNMDGTLSNQITQGAFWVGNIVRVDEKNKFIYFLAGKENTLRTDFYKIGFDGKGLTRLSFGDYSQSEILLSPSGKYFISTYSNTFTPPKMSLVDDKGKLVRELGDSKGIEFDDYDLAKNELHTVKTRDSLFDLTVKITYPLHFDQNKKYPVLIEVYGGHGLGTFNDHWSDDLREQWWAKEGLIQMTMDYRSSGHFGKAGMNYIFRQMGKYEIEDFMDCARWLRKLSFVDTTKVCFTGYSFGGFMTCMALTYGAGVFTHGIAYYPVTDWSLYDTYYTERFMGTPQNNPDGYLMNSPMQYAKNYKGLIRIVHGNLDDNAHLQNSIQFTNKLQELDKHFEMMIYSGVRHGRSHWPDDKKKHAHNEDYHFIYEHLLSKPMPDIFWK